MPSIFKNTSNAISSTLIKVFGLDKVGSLLPTDQPGPEMMKDIDQMVGQAMSHLGLSSAGIGSALSSYSKTEITRKRQYAEYDIMDEESEVITTALDIYKEDATDFDTFVGARIWVTSGDDAVVEEANEVLKSLKIDKNLPRIARNLAKHGDFMLRNNILDVEKEKDKRKDEADEKPKNGIKMIDTSYHPRDVTPIIKDYKLLGYFVTADIHSKQITGDHVTAETLFAPWEFIHFAIPGDSNFISSSFFGAGGGGSGGSGYGNSQIDPYAKRGYVPEYGQSLLKAARRPYKRSKLMHDVLAISRMTRSVLKRVFKFQTEASNPVQAIASLAIFKQTMEKIGGIDKIKNNLQYEELMNILTQDIFLPIMKGGKGDMTVDSIGGEVDVSNIVDIELFDNRLFMSLRIPKEFLNFSETIGDKQSLLLKDIRYSKRIKLLQSAIKNGIKELLFVHFALQGKILKENDFEVNMSSTSISEDLERLDYFGNAVNTADSMIRMLETFNEKIEDEEGNETPLQLNKAYLIYYILKHIVKLPSFDIDTAFPATAKFAKSQTDKDKEKKKKEGAKKFVESNKKLIDNISAKHFKKDLTEEAREQINTDIIKEYRIKIIPKDLKYDTEGLKSVVESLLSKKEEREKNGEDLNE